MITAEGDNRTVTRNSSFFKNIYWPAVNQGNDESQNGGFGSSADEECIQEPPPAFESSNVPGPNSLDPPNTRHVKDDLPSSSNLVPVPVSQTQTSQSCDLPPLRRSSRRHIPRKILDLYFKFKLLLFEFKLEVWIAMVELFEFKTIAQSPFSLSSLGKFSTRRKGMYCSFAYFVS